jgi:uncharacterized protein GlcG (DUF336 family)
MKTTRIPLICSLACMLMSGPALAEDALVDLKVMTPEAALKVAKASMAACREQGFQVAVAVVDRMGVTQVILRDRYAGAHTPETARRKAWTAVSFREDTLALAELTASGSPQSGVRQVTDALMAGGGVPIEAAGSIVGGIGISGAPGGAEDDACARAGIEAVSADLEM